MRHNNTEIDLETKISRQSATAQARRYRQRNRVAKEHLDRLKLRMCRIVKEDHEFYEDALDMRFQMTQIYNLVMDIEASLKL